MGGESGRSQSFRTVRIATNTPTYFLKIWLRARREICGWAQGNAVLSHTSNEVYYMRFLLSLLLQPVNGFKCNPTPSCITNQPTKQLCVRGVEMRTLVEYGYVLNAFLGYFAYLTVLDIYLLQRQIYFYISKTLQRKHSA
jgi:hypothetical protein